jgi:sigma-B regulation protein RsbQ
MPETVPEVKEPLLKQFNVHVLGRGSQPLLFVHGLGCDQKMWRFITPAFENDYKIVLMDNIGSGESDTSFYNEKKYNSLQGYADDILDVAQALQLNNIILVGHSVSSITCALASIKAPGLIDKIIMVSPSPCYLNDSTYKGGFYRKEIDMLLQAMQDNYVAWAENFSPKIMANPEQPELSTELKEKFCHADPGITKQFARVTFLGDNRPDLPYIKTPVLIMQCSEDILAPAEVGEYMQENIGGSVLRLMKATGHCPQMSAPEETIAAMTEFLAGNINAPGNKTIPSAQYQSSSY